MPLCLCALLLSCTDPRGRPEPPILDLQVPPSQVVTSPGTVTGSLYAYDDDGLKSIQMVFRVAGGAVIADSTDFLNAPFEVTRPLTFHVPEGLASGTVLRLVVRAYDFLDVMAADSLGLTVQ